MIRILSLLAIPAFLLAACTAPESGPSDANPVEALGTPDARKVTTLSVGTAPFDHYFTVQGNVETDRMARVFPMTQGTVERIRVKEGQSVRKGQVLVELDNDALAKNKDELETRLSLAKDILSRQERLWSQGIGTEVSLLEARNNVEALEEGIAAFSEQIQLAKVTAPFSGIVDRIFAKEGEMASPMTPVARVLDLDQMYVRAKVSDHYIGDVQAGQRVDILVPGADTLHSTIGRVGQYIEPANRTFEIVVPISGDHGLLPNQFVSLRINDLHVDAAITLPSGLIQQDRDGQDFVYVIENSEAKRQPVSIGTGYQDRVLILGGLAPGTTIIDRGAGQVVEGETIQVIR